MAGLIDELRLQWKLGDVTLKLIVWNALCFIVPEIVFAFLNMSGTGMSYYPYVSLSSDPSALAWKPWSLLSYAFIHAGIWHLVFNMLMLSFAGRLFLTYFTQKQFLGLYLLGAMFSGVIYIATYALFPSLSGMSASLVGASAAVMAVLFATVAYLPSMELRLLLVGNVKLWYIAAFLIVVDLLQLPMDNTGGHISHLAGAAFGWFYINRLRAGQDFASWLSNVLNIFGRRRTPFKKVHRNAGVPKNKPASRIITKDKAQQQIDDILDKISRSGYESLSKEEKDFLFRAGKE
jgi:membrane associated rhomboid family serine protease